MSSLTARTVRRWYCVHKWTSLICTAILLISCVTGLPMIFNDELDAALQHHVAAAVVPPDTPQTNLDAIVAQGQRKYPNWKILSLGWDDDEPRIFLSMAPHFDPKPGESRALIIDQHTGNLLEESSQKKHALLFEILQAANTLHRDLYAGLSGELLLGVMGSFLVISLISGTLLYGPFMRRLDFGTVRTGRSKRVKWFDLHNLLGIVTLTWTLAVASTGIMNTLSTPLFSLWIAQSLPGLMRPYRGQAIPTHFSSVDAAFAATQKTLPNASITGIGFPDNIHPYHYVVWTKGNTHVTSRLFTPVLIDARTGQVAVARGLPWYLRTLEVSRPLHFGDYGGIPLKILWALFDIVLIGILVSGVYVWLSRRRTPIEDELNRLVILEEQPVATVEAQLVS